MTDDERRILAAYAAAGKPVNVADLAWTINPPPNHQDGRTRQGKAWLARQLELLGLDSDLHGRGFLYEAVPATGDQGGRNALTPAGRAALHGEWDSRDEP